MLKLIVLVRRGDGVSHEHLVAKWQDAHMPAVIKQVQPEGYRVTFFESDAPFDGMATLYFADPKKARRWYTTADLATALNDGFFALTDQKPVVLVCEEHVIVDGPQSLPGVVDGVVNSAVKVTGLLRRKPDADAETFYNSWLDDHAPNVSATLAATPGGLRYVVSHATLGGAKPEYAGLAEVYYADADAARAHMQKLKPDNFLQYAEPAGFLNGYEVIGIA